jgi:hypothetical protein
MLSLPNLIYLSFMNYDPAHTKREHGYASGARQISALRKSFTDMRDKTMGSKD